MRRWIDDLPIRNKFILLYLLGVLLPIIVLLYFVLNITTADIRERERLNAKLSFDRVYVTMESHMASVVMLSNAVEADEEILSALETVYDSPSTYYSHYYQFLRPQVFRYRNAYAHQVTAVELYSVNSTALSGGVSMRIDRNLEENSWFPAQSLENAAYVPHIYSVYGQADRMVISLIRGLKTSEKQMRFLKIDLNTDPIRRAIEEESDYLTFYLSAPDGFQVMSSSSTAQSAALQRRTPKPKDTSITRVFGDATAMRGWELSAFVNPLPMEQDLRQAIFLGISIGLLCTLLASALSLIMVRSIGSRSKELLWHMDNMAPDNFVAVKGDKAKDEIGELSAHFNAMSSRLNQLINDVYILQLRQKSLELERVRGELKYLQAQINPHFLFNTLNGILVVCVRNGYTELTEIIHALAKLMRRKIDSNQDMVPLREEIEFVNMVLKIERFRFGEKLEYHFTVNRDTEEYPVPVMCVQGLVENACKHGVQRLSGPGVITIRAWKEGDTLAIDVQDNGVGMTEAHLQALQASMVSLQDGVDSIGLQNIYRRLVLHYGEQAQLTLSRANPQGMVASIRIPVKEEAHA